jgi:hypothetical protein
MALESKVLGAAMSALALTLGFPRSAGTTWGESMQKLKTDFHPVPEYPQVSGQVLPNESVGRLQQSQHR